METSVAAEEFITIVPVGENKPPIQDLSFVTVLTVGLAGGAAEVIVQRPRGARLGLGLKFEGGSAATEKVRRLLVQSCADDSPAANAITPWGKLIPGDEILAIDGVSVSELTRIDCVRRLKDSDEKLMLLVRHFESNNNMDIKMLNEKEAPITTALVNEITRPTSLPPPVPPRKLGKKNSFKDKTTLPTVGEQNTLTNVDQPTKHENVTNNSNANVTKLSRKSSFDSHLFRKNKESLACLKKGSPEEVRRLVRRLSDGKAIPPEAEVYIDLLSNEWERCLALADAESDDTGSSISTVIDRLGSMANSVENSIPSTPIMQPKSIDIQKVLNSIENIDDNILRDMTTKKLKEQKTDINENGKTLDKSLTTNNLKNKTAISTNLQVSEDINVTSNKKIQSDKNNNNTVDENVVPKMEIKQDVITKQNVIHEKPKPMPRNTKVERSASERKRRPIPIPEPPVTPIVDQLLTPTKKNCIETWLQRSEAEMNNKTAEKLEETPVPEILPRLIDFVPKTQFVENANETQTCTRPTSAPPPPPVDTREDGSGASLGTIGELDESSDVTDNAKRVDNDSPKRKTSYDKNYWNERLNRSDAEDKSLSNDETAVPTCPRQPPDGVETPSDVIEKIPGLPTKLPPPRLTPSWPTTRPRFSYTSRTQDARSEASVKDKIAMFSSDLAISTDRLDKCGTLPVRSHSTLRKSVTPCVKNYTEISSLDRRLTKSQDNLDEPPRSYKRHTERPEVLGGGENTMIETKPMKYIQKDVLQKPLFYGSTTTLTSEAAFTRPVFHGRSISEDNSSKNTVSHKSNLEYLIEQRKKSMSKLRGLVIPEMQCNPIVDLPEIKVKDNLSKMFLQKSSKPEIKSENKVNNARPLTFNDSKWKTNFLPNNLPKYSPAFKRKSLQVYSPSLCLSKESTPERKFAEKVETINKINNIQSLHKPLKASSEITRTNYINSPHAYKQYDKNNLNHNVTHNFKTVEVKICTTTEVVDSDNDSAMSSTQSSYRSSASSPMHHLDHVESDSSRMSPKIQHYATYIKSNFLAKPIHIDKNGDEYIKRKVCRSVSSETNVSLSSSAGSGATSGSQASCSSLESSVADSEKRRVSKTNYNVDTINRRNILASAKCRSGRDAKLKSPVIETKFSHESHDRSPSPVSRPPERLSTLPSNVSVITNKGDSRRRNKVVVDSDSDSEGEVTVRQRKSDFKNSRLKRNSSTNNKTKSNGIHVEADKNEEVPQVIKDKIMNEINKAGLDDYNRLDKKLSPEIIKAYSEAKPNSNNYRNLKNEEKEKRNVQVQKDLENRINVKPINTLNVSRTAQLAKSNTQQNDSKDIMKIETHFIHLKKGNGSGVGLILAGGTDCEAKDVTVHRVLSDSIAAKAGIQKGTKIKSINGCLMTGLTHAQSVSILKEQRSEVVIEIENETKGISKECGSDSAESKGRLDHEKTNFKDAKEIRGSVVTVLLEKAGGGAGLGFGLDGGRDSPNGDRPLTIKKLFAGGAAAQSGRVLVGAELLSAGGQSFEGFTRTQAWAALKALPAGQVSLVLKDPTDA